MKTEQQVCSPEEAVALKKAGIGQHRHWYWINQAGRPDIPKKDQGEDWQLFPHKSGFTNFARMHGNINAAFTASELMDILPAHVVSSLNPKISHSETYFLKIGKDTYDHRSKTIKGGGVGYECSYTNLSGQYLTSDSSADRIFASFHDDNLVSCIAQMLIFIEENKNNEGWQIAHDVDKSETTTY